MKAIIAFLLKWLKMLIRKEAIGVGNRALFREKVPMCLNINHSLGSSDNDTIRR